MAIGVTALTSSGNGSTTDASSYVTASITPSANKLIVIGALGRQASGTPATPTVTGCGLTWSQIVTNNPSAVATRRQTLLGATGSPSTDTLTIDFGGTTQSQCWWSVFELDGVDLSGGVAGAVVQTKTLNFNNFQNVTLTMTSALANANNIVIGALFKFLNEAVTAGVGTLIHQNNYSENSTCHATSYGAPNGQSVQWNNSTIQDGGACGFEVKADTSTGQPTIRRFGLSDHIASLRPRGVDGVTIFRRREAWARTRSHIYVPARYLGVAA